MYFLYVEATNAREFVRYNDLKRRKFWTLYDGRKLIVYRFILHSDGLTPSGVKERRMGVFYMLSLGTNPNHRGVGRAFLCERFH